MTYPPKNDPKKETDAIVQFIKGTFLKAKKKKAVIAVSGGIDSATSLLLTAKALGPQSILTLHLPSRQTDPLHTQHANQLLDLAKIPSENRLTLPITAIIQKTWRIINHYTLRVHKLEIGPLEFQGSDPSQSAPINTPNRKKINQQIAHLNRLRLGNLAVRIRMLLIFDQAKLNDALVVGTENKSENLLGYFTRFGDEASDLEPLTHLYKTQVIELAKFLNVPEPIILKPPTAGMWQNQTDESELGFSYYEADPILYLHFEKHLSTAKIIDLLAKKTRNLKTDLEKLVVKVLETCQASDFKHQLPYTFDHLN